MRVVLGVGGGIAAYKVAMLVRLFTEAGDEVRVVPTRAALEFVGAPTWAALSGHPVHTDVFTDVEQVPHVRIGREADLVVVAPATADLLARAAHGLADDLLTNTLLTATCPVLMAPAMHTEMWQHPATRANVALLRERGVQVLDPASGRLTGADTGPGRLPEPEQIHRAALALLGSADAAADATPGAWRGRRVVVTAGGTREPLDPVRFLGNRSSGKQGYALAAEGLARGADVVLVSANVDLPAPDGARVVEVGTALELRDAVRAEVADGAEAVIMAAAVADFRPATYAESKIKKRHAADGEAPVEDAPTIVLERNPDILAGLVRERAERGTPGVPVLVGFAAETGEAGRDVLSLAREKFLRKGSDLLVANAVGERLTFGQDSTTIHLLTRDATGGSGTGADVEVAVDSVGPVSKAGAAAAIWDALPAPSA